jgi:hypothetical protein
MARTNLQVITDSLRIAGIINEIQTPSAEDAQEALRRMNDMILGWVRHNGIQLGFYPQTSLAANIPIDDEYFEVVTNLLAKRVCEVWGFQVSPDLREAAKSSWSSLLAEFIAPREADLTHVPGSTRNGYSIESDG